MVEKKKGWRRRFLHPLKQVVSCAAISMKGGQRFLPWPLVPGHDLPPLAGPHASFAGEAEDGEAVESAG
jgi:hypothetical protein